jgi:hypothetical protein
MTNFTTTAESISLDHLLDHGSGALLVLFGLFLNFAQVGFDPDNNKRTTAIVRTTGIASISAGLLQFVR